MGKKDLPAIAEDEESDEDVLEAYEVSDGSLVLEARVYPDGCQIVAIDVESDSVMLLAAGIDELNELLERLHDAKKKLSELPKEQQGVPELEEEEDEED